MSDQDLQSVFDQLRGLMKPFEARLRVKTDAPGRYLLDTHHVRADGYVFAFGGVEVKKNYVSYHLLPVYGQPELLENVSERLKKRMQGKSCFNFKTVDDALFAELGELTRRGFEVFEKMGYAP